MDNTPQQNAPNSSRAKPEAIEKGHHHAEAFCLMRYRHEETGEREIIWNSRDGVTPFVISGRHDQGSMKHVAFGADRYAPAHIPDVGDRIVVDLTEDRARELAGRWVERYWDHPEWPASEKWDTKEEAIQARVDDAMTHGMPTDEEREESGYDAGPPDIVTVDEELREELIERRGELVDEGLITAEDCQREDRRRREREQTFEEIREALFDEPEPAALKAEEPIRASGPYTRDERRQHVDVVMLLHIRGGVTEAQGAKALDLNRLEFRRAQSKWLTELVETASVPLKSRVHGERVEELVEALLYVGAVMDTTKPLSPRRQSCVLSRVTKALGKEEAALDSTEDAEQADGSSAGLRAATHPPGPYRIEPLMGDDDLTIILGYKLEGKGHPIPLATVWAPEDGQEGPPSREEAEAIARLFAAAPDLYERVEELEEVAENVRRVSHIILDVFEGSREPTEALFQTVSEPLSALARLASTADESRESGEERS